MEDKAMVDRMEVQFGSTLGGVEPTLGGVAEGTPEPLEGELIVKRRVEYSEEVVYRICEEVASGRSLNRICKEENWAPDKRTFYKWMYRHEEVGHKYARAKEACMEYAAEEILEIADNATPEDYNVARLRVDAYKWAASKLKPKKYGDSAQLKIGGENESAGGFMITWGNSNASS